MIYYVITLFAVACFAAQFAFTKLYEKAVGQSATTSLVMLVVTSFAGALFFFFANKFSVNFSLISIAWAVVFAIIMIPYYMIGIKVLSLGSLATYSMFMMLGGMLVPFFYGIIFLDETISVGKLIGTLLLTVFIIMQAIAQRTSNDGKKSDTKKRVLFFLLCILIFFINGMTGVIVKAHSISTGAVDEMSFTVIYCGMTALASLMILVVYCLKKRKEKLCQIKSALRIKPIVIMTLLGMAGYGGNFLQLLAADKIPASVQFPLVSGGVIVLSAVVSIIFFKEKISKLEFVSVAGAFVATFCFAF